MLLLTSMLYYYAGAIALVVVIAILLKLFYAAQTKNKFKEYQSEIARSHSKILKLEVKNEKLQQQINELMLAKERSRIA